MKRTDDNSIAISNALINDSRLSAVARAFAIQLCSLHQQHGDGHWIIPDLASIPKHKGETLNDRKRYLAELLDHGYVVQQSPNAYTLRPGLWTWPSDIPPADYA